MAKRGSKYAPKHLRYVFEPLKGLKIKNKRAALEDISEFIHDSILEHVSEGKSPVSREGWNRTLSPDYKKIKSKVSGSTTANMELFGDMLDALQVRVFDRNKIAIEIRGEEAEKADGHNKLTGRTNKFLSKKKHRRRFIPGGGQTLKRAILSGIKDIAEQHDEEDDG